MTPVKDKIFSLSSGVGAADPRDGDGTQEEKLLSDCVNAFSVDYGAFAFALGLLHPSFSQFEDTVSTDGKTLSFGEGHFLRCAAAGTVNLCFMHVLLHVLFLHPFRRGGDDYDLACDVCVGAVTDEIGVSRGSRSDEQKRKAVYKAIITKYKTFNVNAAERWLAADAKGYDKAELERLFKVCDHSPWRSEGVNAPMNSALGGESEAEERRWKEIAETILGGNSGSGRFYSELVRAEIGNKYDYRSFLRKFLDRCEAVGQNPDEFDYIYYCLGLERYGNVPLIEHLEYRDDRTASDIVVAIDTSGSTEGEPVARFLEESYSVVSQAGYGRYNLRIIECDDAVREEIVVEGNAQFRTLMEGFRLSGGGGTDFRPVFDRVNDLLRSGVRVKGVIYYTDGKGIFPAEDPGVKTCFVLYGDGSDSVEVPYYAYKINLGEPLSEDNI